jgi:archaellum component FlaC
MGAFEDFVNANLGLRKPLIQDNVPPSQSSLAAGSPGSHFLDNNTNFLYEKTGYQSTDWVKIAEYLGQPRGGKPSGIEGSIQFNSGDKFAGVTDFLYSSQESILSGVSGRFEYMHIDHVTGETGHFKEELIIGDQNAPASDDVFVVDEGNIEAAGKANFSGPVFAPTLRSDNFYVSGDGHISGDLHIDGTAFIHELTDQTFAGTIQGYTAVFQEDLLLGSNQINVEDSLNYVSGKVDTVSGNLDTVSGNLNTVSGNLNTVSGNLDTVSGNLDTVSGNLDTVSGNLDTVSGNLDTVSGNLDTVSGNLDTVSGNLDTVSGNLDTVSGNLDTVSGNLDTVSGNLNTTGQNLLSQIGSSSSSLWTEGSNNDIYYNNGKVGIGTITPSARLEIVGPSEISHFFVAYNNGAGGATFSRVANVSPYNHFIFQNGFVGIGTGNPTSELYVHTTRDGVAASDGGDSEIILDTGSGSLIGKNSIINSYRVNADLVLKVNNADALILTHDGKVKVIGKLDDGTGSTIDNLLETISELESRISALENA